MLIEIWFIWLLYLFILFNLLPKSNLLGTWLNFINVSIVEIRNVILSCDNEAFGKFKVMYEHKQY